jgi:hypothetical protein
MDDYKFVEPKTQASIRTIYIDTDTLNELKAWQKVQQKVLKDCDLVLATTVFLPVSTRCHGHWKSLPNLQEYTVSKFMR